MSSPSDPPATLLPGDLRAPDTRARTSQAACRPLPKPAPQSTVGSMCGAHRDIEGKDAMRDCEREGHIRIDSEKACLSCEFAIQAGDKVAYHVHRCTTCAGYHPRGAPHQGEMLALGDTADPREWGGKG